MREILFRGKRVDNGKWVYGCYVHYTDCDGVKENLIFSHNGNTNSVISETVGEYTGLTDKNGTKIFEGDIVKCHDKDDDFMAVVEFGNPNGWYSWGYQLRPLTKTDFNTDILLWVEMEEFGVTIEVIGNIHDRQMLYRGKI